MADLRVSSQGTWIWMEVPEEKSSVGRKIVNSVPGIWSP